MTERHEVVILCMWWLLVKGLIKIRIKWIRCFLLIKKVVSFVT